MAEHYANETGDEFVGRLTTTMTEGFKAVSITFGLRAGLFKTMVELHPTPKTSQEIADAAGLKERYVREWLGVMVVGGIIAIDEASEKYHLPPHRVPAFVDGTLPNQITSFCSLIPMVAGDVFDTLLDAVKKDGPLGVPNSKYEPFQEIMGEMTISWFVNHLCQTFVPTHPPLKKGLENGFRVLDVCCGRGGAARNFALHFPNSSVVGLDISEEAIKYALEEAKSMNLTNIEYICTDAVAMPADWINTFDYVITYDGVHDLPRPDLLLAEIRRVLKPGGFYSCFEPDLRSKQGENIGVPYALIYYALSLFYCLPVSYQYPGSLGFGACWGRENAVKMLEASGFTVQSVEKRAPAADDVDTVHYWCILN